MEKNKSEFTKNPNVKVKSIHDVINDEIVSISEAKKRNGYIYKWFKFLFK